ncbi:hypothetical protein HanRHA438_Chr10g0459391 [Helianthus annuus]|nr:hypothetical protein HanRHA438_Chr10g0459391 [Helianthus annuus]
MALKFYKKTINVLNYLHTNFHKKEEETNSSTNNCIFLSDEPPSATASREALFNSAAFFLNSSDLGPLIISSTHLATSSPTKQPSESFSTFTPTFQTSVTSFAFVGWSLHFGQAITGTPAAILSTNEFHPQWLKKHPTDRCDKTAV